MIKIENLSKTFGAKYAVRDLSLDIKKGSFFCFLGPNGAGKTTTIKMLTGLLKPSSGSAMIGSFDIQKDALKAKSIIGYIPDQPFLYDKLTGREFLKFVAGIYRLKDEIYLEEAPKLIELFELGAVIDQLVEDYSHGMKQKLTFASSFLHKPEVLIVDEPWVGLDPKNIKFVKDYLKRKTLEEDLTVFMSTHTLSIAEEIADTIGIIHEGRLIHLGSVEEIRQIHKETDSFENAFLSLTK